MNGSEACVFEVLITGARVGSWSDQELVQRIKAKFKLTDAQAATMLKGRCVVKRNVDASAAERMASALCEIGLTAISREMQAKPALGVQSSQRQSSTALPAAPTASRANPNPGTPASAVFEPKLPTAPRPAPLDALLSLKDKRLPRPRTSALYIVGLLAVTFLCIALPLLYVALTGAVAYGWLWYLTHIHHHLPGSIHLKALLYAVPGLTGAVLLVFLVRPLIPSRRERRETITLDPEKEARFVSGVHELCRLIGVAPPVEIRLSCDVNASVHFRTPWLSLFTGHKVLTIGMSMVAGLTSRQFIGVLAHEFGHFAQRFGMICSFTVNSVNAWLEQCAYGEDPWGRKLDRWADEASEQDQWFSWLIGLSVTTSNLAIWLTRWFMAGLFHLSLRLSKYMSRQMEFDADRYEALLAGSAGFRSTARMLRALNHAFGEVNTANIEAWREQRLLRDLPEAVTAHATEFDAARLSDIEEEMLEASVTRYWDSHPPDADRIANAERLGAPGVYMDAAPATLLFANFTAWSQSATRLFYTENEVKFVPSQLGTRDEVLGHVRQRDQQREQLNRFFNGQFQPWPLLQLKVPAQAPSVGWQDCIDRIRARSPEIARRWSQAQQAEANRGLLRAAILLEVSSRQLDIPGPERTPQQLSGELETITSRQGPWVRPLTEDFMLYAQRVQHAVQTMQGAASQAGKRLLETLQAMGELERDAGMLVEVAEALSVLSQLETPQGDAPPCLEKAEIEFANLAVHFLERADRIPQSVTVGETIGGYLRSRCPKARSLAAKATSTDRVSAYWCVPEAFHHLYLLALGELLSLCEAIERESQIRPIRLVA